MRSLLKLLRFQLRRQRHPQTCRLRAAWGLDTYRRLVLHLAGSQRSFRRALFHLDRSLPTRDMGDCRQSIRVYGKHRNRKSLHAHCSIRGSNAPCRISPRRISVGKCIILALVATVNPITVAQFLTFYNDAFLMLELLVLLLGLTMLVDVQQTRLRPVAFTLIACAFLLCTETKFTGLAYAGVFPSTSTYLPKLCGAGKDSPPHSCSE